MTISRRDALATGAAAMVTGAAVATVAAPAVQANDAVLLARVVQFHEAYEAARHAWEKQCAHRAEIEARPDCPPPDPATSCRAYFAFLKANDAFRYCDQSNRLGEQAGALANVIFEAPAKTARGVLENVHRLGLWRG